MEFSDLFFFFGEHLLILKVYFIVFNFIFIMYFWLQLVLVAGAGFSFWGLLVAERRLQGVWASGVALCVLSRLTACGIFLDQD